MYTRTTRHAVMGSGWVLVVLSYATIGPLAAEFAQSPALQVALVALGMFEQGLGSGSIIVPSLPDAQAGLSTEAEQAIV